MTRAFLPTVFVGAVYAVIAFFVPKGGFWINDNGCKLLQVRSHDEKGAWDASIDWSGASIDTRFQFVPIRPPFVHLVKEKLFVQYSPVFALASLWPYRAFGVPGLYLLPLVGGILTVEAVRRLSVLLVSPVYSENHGASRDGMVSGRASIFGALVAGLATPLMFYSTVFWEHTPSTALVSWAALFTMKRLLGAGRGTIIASAVLLALSIYFRDDMYLLGAVWTGMLMYSKSTRRDSLLFLVIGLLTCIPLWAYQYIVVGNPLGLHFSGGGPLQAGWSAYFSDRWPVICNLFVKSLSHTQASVLASIPFLACLVLAAQKPLAVSSQISFLMSIVASVAGFSVLLDHLSSPLPMQHLLKSFSFFAASSVLLLAFFGHNGLTANSMLHAISTRWIVRLILAYFLLYAALAPVENTTAIQWGCRFLLPAYPLLAALTGATLANVFSASHGRRGMRLVATLLFANSIALQAYSVSLLFRRQAASGEFNRLVAQCEGDVIVTDAWFLGQELAPIFFERPIFQFNGPSQWNELESILVNHGIRCAFLIYDLRFGATPPGLAVFDDGIGLIRVGMEVRFLQAPETSRQSQ